MPSGLLSITGTAAPKRSTTQQALYDYGNEIGGIIASYDAQYAQTQANIMTDYYADRVNAEKAAAVTKLGQALAQVGTDIGDLGDQAPASMSLLNTRIAYVTTDACLAIAVILFSIAATGDSTAQENLIFSATILGSIFPDLLVGLGYLYKNSLFKLFTKIHFIFHDSVSRRYGDVPLVFGLGYQAIFLAFALQRLAS
jgi:hypothetical protein